MAENILRAGESLRMNESKVSLNGRNMLIFQDDGNICLYFDGTYTWDTQTDGKNPDHLIMQHDGNLVVYATSGNDKPIWATNTHGHNDSQKPYLEVGDDANMRIFTDIGRPFERWDAKVYNYRNIAFRNNGRGVICTPLLMDHQNSHQIWNGRWNGGIYWNITDGLSSEGSDIETC